MNKFIPYEKLSKRERRARDAERRETWGMSPVTRRPSNPKAYNRKKTRTDIENALNVFSFLYCSFIREIIKDSIVKMCTRQCNNRRAYFVYGYGR